MADWRIEERGEQGSAGWLEQAVKLIIGLRSAALLLTVLDQPDWLVAAAVVLAAVASFVPLRFWNRVGPSLVRHPGWLATEIVLATLILVLSGVESPFYSFTLGTALLGGLLYGWGGAVLFSPMLVAVYFWVVKVRAGVDPIPEESFQLTVGLPALYLIAGGAGALARRLLDRIAGAERELAEQERAAAAERERGRLARDMHDSLAKTVHGIGFAALALARRIERDPAGSAVEARRLAEDAKQAAQEARDLIAGLRTERESELPPGATLRGEAQRWSQESGLPVDIVADEVDELPPVAARELRWILKEALRNVSRHAAGATYAAVRVRALGGRVVLSVTDDGPGFEVPDDLGALSADRHYGLVGMRERAQIAGGDLMVESAPGEGCTISAWVPAAGPETPVEPAPPTPAAEPSRTVPGYTWQ